MRNYTKGRRKLFFFEKNNQKTFAPLREVVALAVGNPWT
jgi:hypothetical protein